MIRDLVSSVVLDFMKQILIELLLGLKLPIISFGLTTLTFVFYREIEAFVSARVIDWFVVR